MTHCSAVKKERNIGTWLLITVQFTCFDIWRSVKLFPVTYLTPCHFSPPLEIPSGRRKKQMQSVGWNFLLFFICLANNINMYSFQSSLCGVSSNGIYVNDNLSRCSSIHLSLTLLTKATYCRQYCMCQRWCIAQNKAWEMIDTYIGHRAWYMQRTCSSDVRRESHKQKNFTCFDLFLIVHFTLAHKPPEHIADAGELTGIG